MRATDEQPSARACTISRRPKRISALFACSDARSADTAYIQMKASDKTQVNIFGKMLRLKEKLIDF